MTPAASSLLGNSVRWVVNPPNVICTGTGYGFGPLMKCKSLNRNTEGHGGVRRGTKDFLCAFELLLRAFFWVVVILLMGCQPLSLQIPPDPTPAPLQVTVTGLVENPFVLTTGRLAEFSQVERASIMVCPTDAYPTEEATWQGVLVMDLLKAAGLKPRAQKVIIRSGFDKYKQTFSLEALENTDIFLAVTKENRPMTFDEGGPARIVAHDQAGYRWVRWVNLIEVTE